MVPYKKQRNGPELDETQDATNKLITTARIMVERTIGRLKVFNCLCAPWRNRLWFHRVFFMVLANIVNLALDIHPLISKLHAVFTTPIMDAQRVNV